MNFNLSTSRDTIFFAFCHFALSLSETLKSKKKECDEENKRDNNLLTTSHLTESRQKMGKNIILNLR